MERVDGSRGPLSARRASRQRWRGCLETAGLVFFAALLLGFAVSTWLQHRSGGRDRSPAAAPAETGTPSVDRSRIRIDVRNGSGIEGAAGRVTELLREHGFDVVDFGNADRFDYARTRVVDQRGEPAWAGEVASVLRGAPVDTLEGPGSSEAADPSADVIVVIGSDIESLLTQDEKAPRSGWRGWLDRLRGH